MTRAAADHPALPVAVTVTRWAAPIALAVALAAVGCTAEPSALGRSGFTAPPAQAPGGSAEAQPLFAEDRLHEYAIRIEPARLAELMADPFAEKYVEAAVTADGVQLGRAGVRWKGSSATLHACFRDGRQVCPKAPLKIKTDAFDDKAQLFGLRRINLHAFADDPSLMHERLAYDLFRAMDVPAPRTAHARVTLNGQFLGLYLVVEDIDGRFTADRWPGRGAGNLYKELWPGNGEPPFDQALRSNRDAPDHRRFSALNNLVRAARPEVLPGIVDEWLDLEHLARFVVVDEAINNWEGPRAFPCDSGASACRNFNHFWYQDPQSSRFWLLPWDLNATFRLADPLWRVPRWTDARVDCSSNARFTGEDGRVLRAPACDRVLSTLARTRGDSLTQARQRLAALWDPAALGQRIDRWAALLEQAVIADDRGPGPVAFHVALQELKRDLEVGRAALDRGNERLAEGTETMAVFRNTFEGADRGAFLARTRLHTNRRSGGVHELNRAQPLVGTQDVRVEFQLDNDLENGAPVPFSQNALLRLPFRSGTTLLQTRRIHFTWKSNAARSVQVMIEGARPWRDQPHPRLYATVETRVTAGEYTIELSGLKPEGMDLDAEATRALTRSILQAPEALLFQIFPVGLINGLLPNGKPDVGTVQIDDIVVQ